MTLNISYLFLVFGAFYLICSNYQVAGGIGQNKYKIYSGKEVTSSFAQLGVRSMAKCAMACNMTTACVTATYDVLTKQCRLSVDTLMNVFVSGNQNLKTMTAVQDIPVCIEPPTAPIGTLTLTSVATTSSVAIFQCPMGYEIGPNSPTSLNCDVSWGWQSTATLDCVALSISPVGYYGTSFVTGFMQNGDLIGSGVPTLLITCAGTATVRVDIPYLAIVESHTVTSHLTLTYPNTLVLSTSGSIETKAVIITSNTPIMVYVADFMSGSSEGTIIIPTPRLQTNYFIAGHPSTLAGSDEFVVIGTSDATSVTIEYRDPAITPVTVTLNQNQTYYMADVDLSGTSIVASSPVAVLSGHICANIPDNSVVYCDYITEAMPPLTSLDTVHVVSYMKPRPDFTISIVVTVDLTQIKIFDINGNMLEDLTSLMRKDAVFRTYTGSKTISIVSSSPVMIHQYGHGSGGSFGDPSMMFIPGVNFYGQQYEFVIPSGYTPPCTLAMVLSDLYSPASLKLNSQNFTPTQVLTVTIPNNGVYNVVYADVQAGFNTLVHDTGVPTIGAWVYGSTSIIEFAWALGYAV